MCVKVKILLEEKIFFQIFHSKAFLELLAFKQDEDIYVLGPPN